MNNCTPNLQRVGLGFILIYYVFAYITRRTEIFGLPEADLYPPSATSILEL
jgi:hypothetical protein